jgi:hypothetical protein
MPLKAAKAPIGNWDCLPLRLLENWFSLIEFILFLLGRIEKSSPLDIAEVPIVPVAVLEVLVSSSSLSFIK